VRSVIVLGTGGTSLDIVDTLGLFPSEYCLKGFLDDAPSMKGAQVFGHPVLGALADAPRWKDALFVNGIGSPRNHRDKPAILARTGLELGHFLTLVHPTAYVSSSARLGRGVVLLQHVTIAVNAEVGDQVVILPSSIVSHDARVGDFTCIAGGVCISGRARIGRAAYLGTNASVREDISIGDGALLAMGAVAHRDVPAGETWAGVPARRLRGL
jgi:sugar O-acyltransferase (sialic acid O-acetyltransferase NeuD family)